MGAFLSQTQCKVRKLAELTEMHTATDQRSLYVGPLPKNGRFVLFLYANVKLNKHNYGTVIFNAGSLLQSYQVGNLGTYPYLDYATHI